jgi:hypothetical protein
LGVDAVCAASTTAAEFNGSVIPTTYRDNSGPTSVVKPIQKDEDSGYVKSVPAVL